MSPLSWEWWEKNASEVLAAFRQHAAIFLATFAVGVAIGWALNSQQLNIAHERIEQLRDRVRGAEAVRKASEHQRIESGYVTIADDQTRAEVTFKVLGIEDMPSTNYFPALGVGSEDDVATVVAVTRKTKAGFTIDAAGAPGRGKEFTIGWQFVRPPS